MSEAPYMQLYVGDYLGDTRHLTTEQHGAYLLLLMAMWSSDGTLPNDEAKLARMAGVGVAKWRKIGPDVMAYFVVDGGEITQKRLKKEREKWALKSSARREAGKRGGEAKAMKNKDPHVANATANATILPQQNATIIHIPSPEEEKKTDAIASAKTKRQAKGTRLPEEWAPDFDAIAFSAVDSETTGNPPLTAGEIERELAKFRDYWPGQPGQKGVKTDWQGTFRNWLRKAADDKQNRKSAYAPRAGAADKMADAFSHLRAKAAGSADAGPGDFSGGGPLRLIPGSRGS
jgi:uncharacterized protein YdaU (DUF1376 family)